MQKDRCLTNECNNPQWMRWVLLSAGFMEILFAVWSICWPDLWFKWSGIQGENYREMWMTVGMLNGVLGIGLILAASNPIRHWPNILIAFIAKCAAPIGFLWATSRGVFPIQAGWVILLNDIIWLIPLSALLWATIQAYAGRPPLRDKPFALDEALKNYKLNDGVSLHEASQERPLAVVFLRHFGCTFTRQLLRELEGLKKQAEKHNAKLVLVHMLQHGEEKSYLNNSNIARISDPYCELYRTFGLGKGGVLELFGPRVVIQGVMALIKGCGVGHLAGDGLQLPGAFLVAKGRIQNAQRAKTAADLPALEKLFDYAPNSL